MEAVIETKTRKDNWFFKCLRAIKAFFTNPTTIYILKRILTSLITLVLLAALVTALLRLLPDDKFYNNSKYMKILGQAGEEVANRYVWSQLFKAGIVDVNNRRISIFESVFKFLYYILPIPKQIPVRWTSDYSQVLKYWTGLIYLGESQKFDGQLVLDVFKQRCGISFIFSMVTVVFTYLISVPMGIAMAKKPGGTADKIGNIFIVLNYAIPAIVFYLIMNKLFGLVKLNGSSFFGFKYDASRPFITLMPPLFCMIFLSIPGVVIWVRRFMTDELSSDYVKFARSKGLSEKTIFYKHVFRNAVVPLVRNVPATIIFAFVGSYYVETIWGIPGTGNMLVTFMSVQNPDIQGIQSLTVIYGAMSILAFLLGDIITVFFDPRIKLTD